MLATHFAANPRLQLRGEDLNLRPLGGYEFDLDFACVVSSTVYVSLD
jgi:hypothetical protein